MVNKIVGKISNYRPKIFIPPAQALRNVTSKDNLGVYASSDTLFKGAVFGRDSMEVAEDVIGFRPKLVRQIILTMASLQGLKSDKITEEEPGKIIHEYRRIIVDGRRLSGTSLDIFEQLSRAWGGDNTSLAYYGSIDATPQFIRLTGKYCRLYGSSILQEPVVMRNGDVITLEMAIENSLDWLLSKLKKSKSGLLEYQRRNEFGIENQVWKDSREFYVHEDGQMANHNKPIASIEVQALAYDALIFASEILQANKALLNHFAQQLQKKTIRHFWMPKRNYFALGLDYDDRGKTRIIQTLTANPAEMLDSFFFTSLDLKAKQKYITAIIREVLGTEFLTDVGIRSRALSEAKLVSFWDYHGSYTSWPKETYDIAKGLNRQGFPKLAAELENRLVNLIRALRSYPEFVYVDARGRVLGVPTASRSHGEIVYVESSNKPEKIQAWTISAILSIKNNRKILFRKNKVIQLKWQKDLEAEVLRNIPHVRAYRSSKELAARYPAYPYRLNEG
jgi:glycogen debranching enzyme